MPANQAFMDRIHRIETGHQWVPEGIVLRAQQEQTARHKSGGGVRNLVSFLMSLVMVCGLAWVFVLQQTEIAGQFMAGDFSAISDHAEATPPAGEMPDA